MKLSLSRNVLGNNVVHPACFESSCANSRILLRLRRKSGLFSLVLSALFLFAGTLSAHAGVVLLSPGSNTFPDQTVGNSTAPIVLTLHNGTSSALSSLVISLAGPNHASFTVASTTCGSTLGASNSCTISTTFNPASGGPTGLLTATVKATYASGLNTAGVNGNAVAATPAGSAYLYVSPLGCDSGCGTGWVGTIAGPNGLSGSSANGPLASLHEAKVMVENIISTHASTGISAVTVFFENGTYPLASLGCTTPCSESFGGTADSGITTGMHPISVTYQNLGSEVPIVSGGYQIPTASWFCTGGSPNLCSAALIPSSFPTQGVSPNMETVGFEQLFVTDSTNPLGVRRFRSVVNNPTNTTDTNGYNRLPTVTNNNPFEIVGTSAAGSCAGGANENCCPNEDATAGTCTDSSTGGTLTGGTTGPDSQCFDQFSFSTAGTVPDISSSWLNFTSDSVQNTGNYRPMGLTNTTNYPVGDIMIDVFENWTMSKERLSYVDSSNNAYLEGPTGQSSEGMKTHGYHAGKRYLVENVLDNFTGNHTAGTWFLDRSEHVSGYGTNWVLYYYPETGEDPTQTSTVITVPLAPQLITANNLNNVTFSGLTFSYSNWVVPAIGYASFQGEPGASAALSFTDSSNITLKGVSVSHMGGWGVEFVTGHTASSTTSDTIENSFIYDIGAGGARIGTNGDPSDTDTNVPQSSTISNTFVEGWSRTLPGAPGLYIGDAHDNTITGNTLTDGYNSGIAVCLPTVPGGSTFACAGDPSTGTTHGPYHNTITSNLVYNLGQGITDDMGGIYVAAGPATGNEVVGNVIHDVLHAWIDSGGYGGNGIYLDTDTSNVTVKNNLVYRVSQAGMQVSVGPDSSENSATDDTGGLCTANPYGNGYLTAMCQNEISNNIFSLFAGGAMTRAKLPTAATKAFDYTNNLLYFDKGQDLKGQDATIQFGLAWWCWNSTGLSGGPCSSIYNFASNAYYDAYNGATNQLTGASAFFTIDGCGDGPNDASMGTGEGSGFGIGYDYFSSAQGGTSDQEWQSAGAHAPQEDASPSVIGYSTTNNPGFASIGCTSGTSMTADYTPSNMMLTGAVSFSSTGFPFKDASTGSPSSIPGLPLTLPTSFPLALVSCSWY